MEDPYQILGIHRRATLAEIRQAYRRRSMEVHPDLNGGSNMAEEAFKRLNEAFQILSDPARRRQYDQQCPTSSQNSKAKSTATAEGYSRPQEASYRAPKPQKNRHQRNWAPYFIIYTLFIAWMLILAWDLFRQEQLRPGRSPATERFEQGRFLELYRHYPDLISTREAEVITGKDHLPAGFTSLLESILQRGDTMLFRKLILLQADPENYRKLYSDEKDQRYPPAGNKGN